MVRVHLEDVPVDLRMQAAEALALKQGIIGLEFAELLIAAECPNSDAVIYVPAWKATRVLVEGRLPPGPIPEFDRRTGKRISRPPDGPRKHRR